MPLFTSGSLFSQSSLVTDLMPETCSLKHLYRECLHGRFGKRPYSVGSFYALYCGLIALEEPSTLPEASMALALT